MKKGFTLIEVLITLSILVILMSIVAPNYTEIRKNVDKNKYILNSILVYDYVKAHNEKNGIDKISQLKEVIEDTVAVTDLEVTIGGEGVESVKYKEKGKELRLKLDNKKFTYKLYLEGKVIYSED
ncbi:type II secretion system protein [uncultured Clostridium sp.]|uniref:type II secretion system protein n=1 Tax=uncultured Clostridium sp. TaxID=59620 RepID=UPI0025E3453F|nr:type II secretion system protein [uncultured Clostridium sp.]